MVDEQLSREKYVQAVDALTEVSEDPDATPAQHAEAVRAINELHVEFIGQRIADLKARAAQFAAFIRRMEQVIAAAASDPILGGIKRLKGIVDKSKDLIDLGQALLGEAGAAAPAIAAGGAAAPPAQKRRPGVKGAKKAATAVSRDDSPSYPLTTRAEAKDRREPTPLVTAAQRIGRKLDAQPDRIDIRDWFYEPTLAALPDAIVNVDEKLVLDQGTEGACTGFALAAVINHLLKGRGNKRRVSERMIYEMARRYDEWPGEGYDGSSARGAIKGWVAHGVCEKKLWTPDMFGTDHLTDDVGRNARGTPGGAYYRVTHRQVRDMHSALSETGILYATLMVHSGWDDPSGTPIAVPRTGGKGAALKLPVIERKGRATDGHAVALVGYTADGFIVQNSWGPGWGAKGFALLPYEDFLLHATDVWVAQLGVPVSIDLGLTTQTVDETRGLQRAAQAVPLDVVRPFVVNVGNNGELSASGEYWTSEADVQRLFDETIPAQTAGWKKKRVLLYLHGGLNSEVEVGRRVVSFKNVMLANEIYPLHVMWETGAMETIKNLIKNLFTDADERAGGVGDWLRKVRDNLVEAKDRTFEFTVAAAGTALWGEMKRNARLSSEHVSGLGAMQIVNRHANAAMADLNAKDRAAWELHVVAHSAGSIYAALAMPHLVNLGLTFKSIQLMAPAISVDLFMSRMMPYVAAGSCPHPTNYLLSDVGERDDTVGPYGKSLLYLVSNAFEGRRDTPLLGMERYISDKGQEGGRFTNPDLNHFFARNTAEGLPSLVVSGKGPRLDPEADAASRGIVSRSETHGGFDNDPETLNSVLYRILGDQPEYRWFTADDLRY